MRVSVFDYRRWMSRDVKPTYVRPDEMASDPWTPVRPIYHGSLALQIQLMDTPDPPEYPNLAWPPELEDRGPRTRGRPVRRDALWEACAKLTKPMARAVLVVATDFLTHRRKVNMISRGPGYVIERNPRYYSAEGDLSEGEADRALCFVTHQLRANAVKNLGELSSAGLKLRRLKFGKHGTHWHYTASACDDLAYAVGMLQLHGIRRPATCRPLKVTRHAAHHGIQVDSRGPTKNLHSICPFHDDTNASLHLNDNGLAWCYGGCGGGVGRWEAVEGFEGHGIGDGPSRVRIFKYLDAEIQVAQDIQDHGAPVWDGDQADQGQDLEQIGAPDFLAQGANRAEMDHRGDSYSPVAVEVQGSVLDLGLNPRKAASAGLVGVAAAQKYVGAYAGSRDSLKKMPTVEIQVDDGDSRGFRSVKACRPMGYVLGKLGQRYGMGKSYSAGVDVLDILRKADGRSRGKKTTANAEDAYAQARASCRPGARLVSDKLPDRYVSVDFQAHQRLGHTFESTGKYGGTVRRSLPTDFKPMATTVVMIDIDKITLPQTAVSATFGPDELSSDALVDLRGGEGCEGDAAIARAAEVIRPLLEQNAAFTGRCAFIRTGWQGVQVVAELEQTRWDPTALWASADFRRLIKNLAAKTLQTLRAEGCSGGEIDPTSFQPGRFFRRPSWRIDKTNRLFRSRLAYCTP